MAVHYREGQLCTECGYKGRCDKPPTPDDPINITCDACAWLEEGAEKCVKCGGSSKVPLATRCPREIASGPGVQEMLRLCDWMGQGIPPVAGGALNQTTSFMQSLAVVKNTTAEIEAQLRRRK